MSQKKTDFELSSPLNALCQQDIMLEQMELILYRMQQLAQQSALEDCNTELRQQLQEELESLTLELDQVSSVNDN